MAHVHRVRARLALPAQRRVRGLLDGEYASALSGRGMELDDLREYVRGDDVADVDWKASARARQLLVKRYVALRQHTVLLIVDTGRQMAAHATVDHTKRELAALAAGTLGWLAVRHGDRVGVLNGDAQRRHGLPPRQGEVHLERCLASAYDATTVAAADSDLVGLLQHVARTVRRRSIALIVCDVPPDDARDDELAAILRRLVAQHEVMVVTVGDLDPATLPAGAGVLADVGGGALPSWAATDPRLARELRERDGQRLEAFSALVAAAGGVHQHVTDADSAPRELLRMIERHRHARRR